MLPPTMSEEDKQQDIREGEETQKDMDSDLLDDGLDSGDGVMICEDNLTEFEKEMLGIVDDEPARDDSIERVADEQRKDAVAVDTARTIESTEIHEDGTPSSSVDSVKENGETQEDVTSSNLDKNGEVAERVAGEVDISSNNGPMDGEITFEIEECSSERAGPVTSQPIAENSSGEKRENEDVVTCETQPRGSPGAAVESTPSCSQMVQDGGERTGEKADDTEQSENQPGAEKDEELHSVPAANVDCSKPDQLIKDHQEVKDELVSGHDGRSSEARDTANSSQPISEIDMDFEEESGVEVLPEPPVLEPMTAAAEGGVNGVLADVLAVSDSYLEGTGRLKGEGEQGTSQGGGVCTPSEGQPSKTNQVEYDVICLSDESRPPSRIHAEQPEGTTVPSTSTPMVNCDRAGPANINCARIFKQAFRLFSRGIQRDMESREVLEVKKAQNRIENRMRSTRRQVNEQRKEVDRVYDDVQARDRRRDWIILKQKEMLKHSVEQIRKLSQVKLSGPSTSHAQAEVPDDETATVRLDPPYSSQRRGRHSAGAARPPKVPHATPRAAGDFVVAAANVPRATNMMPHHAMERNGHSMASAMLRGAAASAAHDGGFLARAAIFAAQDGGFPPRREIFAAQDGGFPPRAATFDEVENRMEERVPARETQTATAPTPTRLKILVSLQEPIKTDIYMHTFDTLPPREVVPGLQAAYRRHGGKVVTVVVNTQFQDFTLSRKICGIVNYPPCEQVGTQTLRIYYYLESLHVNWLMSDVIMCQPSGKTKFEMTFDKDQQLVIGDRVVFSAYVYIDPKRKFVSDQVIFALKPSPEELRRQAAANGAVNGQQPARRALHQAGRSSREGSNSVHGPGIEIFRPTLP